MILRFCNFIDNERVFRNNIHHGPVLKQLFISLFVVLLSFGLLSFGLLPFGALAQTAEDARQQLSNTLNEIKAANKRQKEIAEQRGKLRQEMRSLEKDMVRLARETSGHEQDLSVFEDKLAILESQKEEKTKALNASQAELSNLISAMVRLKELPPETVIAMPGRVNETLEAARALSLISHVVQEEADSIKAQLRELDDLEKKIKKNHQDIVRKSKEVEEKRADLARKIKERSELQEKLSDESEQTKAELAELKERSHNLEELVDALGKLAPKREEEEKQTVPVPKRRHHDADEMRSFVDAKGHLHMPVSGKVVKAYGTSGDTVFSRGITVRTREGANVVAPFDGEVVYAGNFRDYGRIVIIRHSDDYHTLLSGMEHVNCTAGQFIMEGEPIGAMGRSDDMRNLYIEVRKSSKPVDPSPWFRGMT